MSDTVTEHRLDRLETDVRDVKTALSRLEPALARVDAMLQATLPHLATKGELAAIQTELKDALHEKPGKVFLMTGIGLLLAAYALGLAGLAALPVLRAMAGH